MRKFSLRDKHILAALFALALGLLVTGAALQRPSASLRRMGTNLLVPLQKGVNEVGGYLTRLSDGFRSNQALAEENRTLRVTADTLRQELDRYELLEDETRRLEALLDLREEYPRYQMTTAVVIAKDPGSWYSRFIVDKGSADGVEVDMNVLANGGLFGIVTEVGQHWARVRSIIDDESNVSAMAFSTSETCTVTGSLLDMAQGTINFYGLRDNEDVVREGEKIVTSNISEKYLPGFTIGYINTVAKDANNLTKSGTITPSATFDTLKEVLIVLEKKQRAEAEE